MTKVRQRSCLFCKSDLSGRRSREDIIPQWLQRHLEISKMVITPSLVHSKPRETLDLRVHTVGQLLAGQICGECNNGWMSRLEGVVKPILLPLLHNTNGLTLLSDTTRHVLAQWTLKTAFVLNRGSSHGQAGNEHARPVPDEHLHSLMKGEIPHDVVVVAGAVKRGRPFNWLQYATWANPKNSARLERHDVERSYKIAISLGELILAVAYYPSREYQYCGVAGHHFPLWLGTKSMFHLEESIVTEPTVSMAPALESFLKNLMLISDTYISLIRNTVTHRLVTRVSSR